MVAEEYIKVGLYVEALVISKANNKEELYRKALEGFEAQMECEKRNGQREKMKNALSLIL